MQTAKKEMHKVEGKAKLLEAEKRQLEGKRAKIQNYIDRSNKALGGYAAQEEKEKSKAREQEELLREAKKRR